MLFSTQLLSQEHRSLVISIILVHFGNAKVTSVRINPDKTYLGELLKEEEEEEVEMSFDKDECFGLVIKAIQNIAGRSFFCG